MKKKLFIFFCFLALTGCEKDILDYRNQFTGDYSFVFHKHTIAGINPIPDIDFDTTYTCNGKVEKSADKNYIKISFSDYSLKVMIYEDGTLEGGCYGKGEYTSTRNMTYFWSSISPGGSTRCDIKGEKK